MAMRVAEVPDEPLSSFLKASPCVCALVTRQNRKDTVHPVLPVQAVKAGSPVYQGVAR